MRALLTLVAFALVIGCGGSGGGRVPAVGIVTLDGAPLADVYVTFRPDDGEPGNGGFAVTDSDGRFEIYYPDTGKGLVPARYKVTVTPPPRAPGDGPPAASPLSANKKAGYPSVYSSPENTPLRVTVADDGEPLKVELFSDPRRSLPQK
jgi:hypothetical protein